MAYVGRGDLDHQAYALEGRHLPFHPLPFRPLYLRTYTGDRRRAAARLSAHRHLPYHDVGPAAYHAPPAPHYRCP